ncbi:MAG: glutamine amidotransferase-related protein, partial [Alphaproteobacteria bacterium]
ILHPVPFVGVCLGAQILARALGAKVWRHENDHVEIGYHMVHPTKDGRDHFDGPMQVFQWHKDGFDLPDGATLLASGCEDFPNQCFRYKEHCFAVQFHPEVTYDMMCRWTVGGAHMLDRVGAMPRDEQLRLYPICDPPLGDWTSKLVDHVIALSERAGACSDAAA